MVAERKMIVERKQLIEIESVKDFMIGDLIGLDTYYATCHKIDQQGRALFIFDGVLQENRRMNASNDGDITYEDSDLRKWLNEDAISYSFFDVVRPLMVPFENGDMLRIPAVGEIFGNREFLFFDEDSYDELPLMTKGGSSCRALSNDLYGTYWLQNKTKMIGSGFGVVREYSSDWSRCTEYHGVRPVFLLG